MALFGEVAFKCNVLFENKLYDGVYLSENSSEIQLNAKSTFFPLPRSLS